MGGAVDGTFDVLGRVLDFDVGGNMPIGWKCCDAIHGVWNALARKVMVALELMAMRVVGVLGVREIGTEWR